MMDSRQMQMKSPQYNEKAPASHFFMAAGAFSLFGKKRFFDLFKSFHNG